VRPLGGKAYWAIPHLPGSRTGSADRHLDPAQAAYCTDTGRKSDEVIVQEKLDGSCVAVARIGDEILPLGREGKLASESRNPARQLFARWVAHHQERFLDCLLPGEHFAGEWLALAHGTRYQLPHEPWVCFDLLRGTKRASFDQMCERLEGGDFVRPYLVHRGAPISTREAIDKLGQGGHGAEKPEGAVWRIERKKGQEIEVILVAKYVRPDKKDGNLLPESSGQAAIWNWEWEGA
jgi:hypothetical protein